MIIKSFGIFSHCFPVSVWALIWGSPQCIVLMYTYDGCHHYTLGPMLKKNYTFVVYFSFFKPYPAPGTQSSTTFPKAHTTSKGTALRECNRTSGTVWGQTLKNSSGILHRTHSCWLWRTFSVHHQSARFILTGSGCPSLFSSSQSHRNSFKMVVSRICRTTISSFLFANVGCDRLLVHLVR